MANRTAYIVGGAAAGVLVLVLLPWWVALLIIAALVGVPVVGYLALDPSQRRRLRAARRRGQLGR
jgi:type IV secretory pathway TrbD component